MKKLIKHFNKKVSMIVPVYNVEQYLRGCLDSLIAQTIDPNEMEILLINDGSTDNSLEICREYEGQYNNIKIFDKPNSGVSDTRNVGIRNALGKYIMYLDSDDMLTPETVKSVTDFFDKVYDQVDLVTYRDQSYKDGQKLPLHYRYQILTKNGIYDLNQYPNITQTRINICVKNLLHDNQIFETSISAHEDIIYLNAILISLMKIGFCSKGEYQYNKDNDTSIMAINFNSIELFENNMSYYETLFFPYDVVPQYLQMMFFNDACWKLKSNILFPHHYENNEFIYSIGRLKKIFKKIDNSIIFGHPKIDNFHKAYWLKFKEESNIAVVNHSYLSNGHLVYFDSKIELIFYKLRVFEGRILLLLSAKSPVFSFIDKPKIFAVVNEGNLIEIKTFDSSFNYYRCKTKTNNFYTFYFEMSLTTDVTKLKFVVDIDGALYNTKYYFMRTVPFDRDLKVMTIAQDNTKVEFKDDTFYFQGITKEEKQKIQANQTEKYAWNKDVFLLRKRVQSNTKENPIWLYYDCSGVEKDNGYYQFIHDISIEDGVARYYISTNAQDTWGDIFNKQQIKSVVAFGSDKHRELFLSSDKVITAFIEYQNIFPFEEKNDCYYRDLYHFEIIYLQHGILHASLPWKYTPESMEVDKVVASSYFEVENFTNKYHFREQDVIPCGMPRYDFMDRNAGKTNRILFAPSWRNYLIGECVDRHWSPLDNKFIKSNYFITLEKFLNSEKLHKMLVAHNMYLDFKPHPIFRCYDKHFEIGSDRITISSNTIANEDYSVFITDFSSFVFDFAYLNRPILYFVPDMLEFKAGLNQYRELDLPFEEAFGDLATTPEQAVDALEKILANGCEPEAKYFDRMDSFFLPLEGCRERLYGLLTNNDMLIGNKR